MATILRSKAVKNVNKGNTSAYYSYVEERNGTNPVIQQLEKELHDYMGFVKKKNAGLLKPGEHPNCKVSDALFDIWNKFEPRVSQRFFYQKLMQTGEFLVQNKEYATASWQCYDRYLNHFVSINLETIKNVNDLKNSFFSEENENEDVTFRALMGHCICMFHFTIGQDTRLQNNSSLDQINEILRFLRIVMQLQLEKDHFCWLVYNATIYFYTMARFLMQFSGFSKILLEYLLYCCLAMESSIPLLGLKYLSWRSTLYAITCQLYYDCKYNEEGEMFARRALSKINELHELELASINGEQGARSPPFREATIKIGATLFKRLVFESRRKNKGILRQRYRLAYKDLTNQQWPRTAVEKLLNEMFDCSSAQFLAIEEALSDSNRRIAMPMPAGGENEFENLDVVLELLYAAEHIVNGGGGKSPLLTVDLADFKGLNFSNDSMMELAIKCENGAKIKNYLRMIKFAYNYENWDVFRRMSKSTLAYIENSAELSKTYKNEILTINLLLATDKYLLHLRKIKNSKAEAIKISIATATARDRKNSQDESGKTIEKSAKSVKIDSKLKKTSTQPPVVNSERVASNESQKENQKENEENIESPQSPTQQEVLKDEDLLSNIAYRLLLIIDSNIPPSQMDLDVIVDITLLLWRKCKDVFQKYQTGSEDNYRWVTKLENFSKWLFILNIIHESMCIFEISTIDPAVFAHCSLRLGLTFESLANVNSKKLTKESSSVVETADDQYSMARTNNTKFTLFEMNDDINEKYGVSYDVRENLLKAQNILKKSWVSISAARASISQTDKTFLCDKNYDENNNDSNLDVSTKTSTDPKKLRKLKNLKDKLFDPKIESSSDSVTNLMADLHVELIFLYHKISMRLLEYKESSKPSKQASFEKEFEILLNDCRKNKISQALLLISKALYLTNSNISNSEDPKVLVQKAYDKLISLQEEDKALFFKHVKVDANIKVKSKIPPAPIICLRTHNKIVVQPRNFESLDGITPSWYRIFATQITQVNAKARISDYSFQGCGEQIPANNCEKVSIRGLTPNEKYVFAVAAYDNNGRLIANSIGDSTEPILASNTLSILMTYTYLCQVCYQINEYNLALKAFDVLWNHFIIKQVKPETETYISQNEVDYEITFHQLNYNVIEKTSPILLRKFVECFFMVSDIETKQKKIYCDLLFDGKIQYSNQIERIRQCEKLLTCIDLASWLNDPQIILQAVVQIYGFLAPLIYYNLAYEPLTEILKHCLISLEEVPSSIFQRKSKNTFESIQHMIACTTFYLSDILKRYNKKNVGNYFNLVGRKLLGLEETIPGKEIMEEINENTEYKEEKSNQTKLNELKALEMYIAKTNANNKHSYFNMLTGNEDASQIYSFIAQNVTKTVFKELTKFRKRPNFFEYLTNLLHKALTEELSNEINDWCVETLEWLQKRNYSILGPQLSILKKPDVISVGGYVHGHARKSLTSETGLTADVLITQSNNASKLNNNNNNNKKKKIKKYKLLIPVDLELSEKMKLEEKQKRAIDIIYDLFPERYENWMRRTKLRRLFQEESAFKSQFYVIWALNNFAILMNRIHQSSPQNHMNFMQRLYNSSCIDAQQFLFDKNNALVIPFDEINEKGKSKRTLTKAKPKNSFTRPTDSSSSPTRNVAADEKLYELKDVSEILADIISGIDPGNDEDPRRNSNYHSADSDHPKGPQHPIGVSEFNDLANNIFSKFKRAIVISHRSKQWTQLQNVCKLMLNCMNSLLNTLPAISYNNRRTFKIQDFFKPMVLTCYLASENLLDMIFFTSPIEKMTNREIQDKINKWYDSVHINKTGGGLKFDLPLDDNTCIDLRFVKEFIFRSIQCLCTYEKWEKVLSIALKFNAMTGYKFAENLSPIIINAQHKLTRHLESIGLNKSQPHFDRLKAELGRYPKIEDLFFLNFKIVIDTTKLKKLETGVKIDPHAHDIYSDDNKSKELISVPLNKAQSFKNLNDALDNSLYISRALLHARRLLSLFLLNRSNENDFFGIHKIVQDHKSTTDGMTDTMMDEKTSLSDKKYANDLFHSNPMDFKNKTFENDDDVYVKEINIDLKTVKESYEKCIQLLKSSKEKDLVTQALHELGNIYHFSKDINSAYRYWNESLDSLTVCSNSLINWRKEFSENGKINTDKLLERCGIWGCLLGGVITSKMAKYYLANDLELKTECCLFSAIFFKSIFSSSVPFSRYDLDYTTEEVDHLCSEFLLPGLHFNSELYRFDIRYVISALNFISIELVNSGFYLNVIPSIALYEYFARTLTRDLTHTVLAKILKIEALIKLKMFSNAILLINQLHRGDHLPHFIDDKFRAIHASSTKYTEFIWNDSKPIYDLNNLKCLETLLSLKLPYNLVKLYGPHLTCRFYLLLCKTYVQIASCLPCLPSLEDYENSEALSSFHKSHSLINPGSLSAAKLAYTSGLSSGKKSFSPDDNPDVIKVFSKPKEPIRLEFIKGCLLGSAKTIILRCLKTFSEDFPRIERYCVSINWQREFKYECNIILAMISDQAQLGYLALQNIVDAMKELAVEEKQEPVKEKKNGKKNQPKLIEQKVSKQIKKGVFQVFDQMSKTHLNSRLWLNARLLFIQFMFNQLNDAGKAKGFDDTITSDFADLSYYCKKCLEETDQFFDTESKAFFIFIEASLDITRGAGLQTCLDKLKFCLTSFLSCNQLSMNGLINFLKASILQKDLSFALNLLNTGNDDNKLNTNIEETLETLIDLQNMILDNLKTSYGDKIELYVNKKKAYFNNIMPDIKNIYNPFLHYLVHIKLRLGSILILRFSMEENNKSEQNIEYLKTCEHALNVICTGIELNKVICERSINLEIELSYKQAFCLKELFMKHKLGTLIEVVDAFNYTITLLHNSTHNLNYIKNCYLELAVLFISIFDTNLMNYRLNQLKDANQRPSKVTITKSKKITPTMMKAMEAALTALTLALKCSNVIKSKMLLPGHRSIKEMKSINAISAPLFVASDLVGYFVLAERKKKYRDSIEEEILSLAPEFEPREAYKSYEEKISALASEANKSITWIHLLNYQSKMQNINNMRNLNTLKNGKNKYIFSDLFTIGFTPLFKSTHDMTGRLYEINKYMKSNLEVYKDMCQAPEPIAEYFRIISRKSSNISTTLIRQNTLYENVKYYNNNLGQELSNKSIIDKEQEIAAESVQNVHSSKKQKERVTVPVDWTHLQIWPTSFDVLNTSIKITESTTADSFVSYLITFNWYKSLAASEEYLISNDDTLIAIIAVKDSASYHKIRFNLLSAGKVKEIHKKLAPLATIADTSLETPPPPSKNNPKNTEITETKSEFLNSLRECLSLIAKLFEKKLDEKKFPFDLIPSNIMDLENMFNPSYGGYTNNESLKKYIFDLFSTD